MTNLTPLIEIDSPAVTVFAVGRINVHAVCSVASIDDLPDTPPPPSER